LAAKTASEMTYTVSGGALHSTQTQTKCGYDELQTLKLTTKNVKSVSIWRRYVQEYCITFFGITVISGSIFFALSLHTRGDQKV